MDLGPGKSAVAAAQRGHRDRGDLSFAYHPTEVSEARVDVGELRGGAERVRQALRQWQSRQTENRPAWHSHPVGERR
ncbi:hypothetical protein EYA84_11920 [Verrucosispora sp. SN26_14.1]|uniref:hypothetical protein n=1 Tax=Verrucosispora sp. SN26_14.1 TaxID=2527879 RepID=UPI0010332382|nr:hypothetical protein [Verrucosispora sp. SN26_14.1]TBL36573.1 hypothetical protein EYA84_11920 [Verrucosispora sp. SN26_14.1]